MSFRVLIKRDGSQVLQESFLGWEQVEGKMFCITKWRDVPLFSEEQAEQKRKKQLDEIKSSLERNN